MKLLSSTISSIMTRPRILWAIGNSITNFAIVATIATMPEEAHQAINLATFYLVFLFWDACFLTINNATPPKELAVGATTVISLGVAGIVAYTLIAGGYPSWFLIPLFFVATWSKAQSNTVLAHHNFTQNGHRIAFIQISILMTTLLALATGWATSSATILAVACFAIAPLASLPSGGLAPHRAIAQRDLALLPPVILDFIKNQVVFIIFGREIDGKKLADILFSRSILSPISLLIATRRQGIEDSLLVHNELHSYYNITTVIMYLFLMSLGLVGVISGTSMAAYVGAWIIVVVLQDLRAHYLRTSLYRRSQDGQIFACVSMLTIGLFAILSARQESFASWMIIAPYVIEIAILIPALKASEILHRARTP